MLSTTGPRSITCWWEYGRHSRPHVYMLITVFHVPCWAEHLIYSLCTAHGLILLTSRHTTSKQCCISINVGMTLHQYWSGPEVIKLFSCSTQLSMKFFLLINVKMPTIVGILTFISRENSILGSSESEKSWISWYFHTYEHLKFHAQLSWAWKKFYNLGPRCCCDLCLLGYISYLFLW